MLLDEAEIVRFAFRLNAGFRIYSEMLADKDNAPYFGMDGQAMQPNYIWRLWMCLQRLAAIFKDRSYTNRAKMWRPHIPESFVEGRRRSLLMSLGTLNPLNLSRRGG